MQVNHRLLSQQLLAGILVAISVAGAAQAQTPDIFEESLDMAELSCSALVPSDQSAELEEAEIAVILLWLYGYLSGVYSNDGLNLNTLLDADALEEFAAEVAAICEQDPDALVLDSVKKITLIE